jgi:hypothetical protein
MCSFMDNSAQKISNRVLFHAVLHLLTSCSELVARQIDCAQLCSGMLSCADREKLKRIAERLLVLGLLARIIGQYTRLQEQRPIRGGRSVNIRAGTEKEPSIVKHEEHAIASRPDGGALV